MSIFICQYDVGNEIENRQLTFDNRVINEVPVFFLGARFLGTGDVFYKTVHQNITGTGALFADDLQWITLR